MTVTTACQAKIRPFRPVNEVELQCSLGAGIHPHEAVLRNYAYKGSETRITWADSDRRNFEGEFAPCGVETPGRTPCILPALHRDECAW